MKTASAPQKPRFSPVAIAIGLVALAGLFGAAGYALALATRPAPAPVASVPPVEKRVEPVAEKIEPKPVGKKADVPAVAKKKAWTKDEAIAEAKRMAEALVDEDFEKAKVNLTQADYIDFLIVKDSINKTESKLPFSACNPRAYAIAKEIGMTNYFTKRIVLWSVGEKFFPHAVGNVWASVEKFRNPESVFNAAIVYGTGYSAMLESLAMPPTKSYPMPKNAGVKAFWESFGNCNWAELLD